MSGQIVVKYCSKDIDIMIAKTDKTIAAVVICAALVCILAIYDSKQEQVAEIFVGGKLVRIIPLQKGVV